MLSKPYWFWVSEEDKFCGFVPGPMTWAPTVPPGKTWAGPFRTFSLAKDHALDYFRQKSKLAHNIAAEIKAERKP